MLRVLLSRDVADVLVQGSAYGAETRFALRTPVPYLAPAVLVWSALVATTVGGSLLLAAGNPAAGIPVTAAGALLAWKVPVRLHRLSRRWLVVVPAGLVVHDHLVLGETMMVRRDHLGAVTLQESPGDEADLTGAVPGRRVRIVMTQPDKIILAPITMRTLGTTEALHVVSFAVAPLRAAAAVSAVGAAFSPGQ
jgi:methyl coenzyme M reductase subunit C